jgi:hypothetical protein
MPAPLPPEQRENLRRVIVEKVLPRFNGDQTAAAEAIGADQATINRLVLHHQGGSLGLAKAVAKYLTDSVASVLGLGGEEVSVPKLRDIAGFETAMEEAKRQVAEEYRGRLDVERLERAADNRLVSPPDKILPGLLIQVALCLPSTGPLKGGTSRRKK